MPLAERPSLLYKPRCYTAVISRRKLSSIFKVRFRLHYSWIVVIILMTVGVITQFATSYPFLPRLILGVIASFIFLLITVVRMLIITLLAVRRGAIIESDTIFAIGGVLDIDKTTTFPSLEVLLAIAGFLLNLIVAGILFTVYQVLAHTGSIMVHVFVQWLAFIYFMLSIFDLLPGLPLDGGRILRAIFWKATKNYGRTTRVISWAGWAIGMAITITGIVLTITTRQWFVGILLALPGLILQNAATHQRRQASERIQTAESTDSIIYG
jgi:Zn-dependent protease